VGGLQSQQTLGVCLLKVEGEGLFANAADHLEENVLVLEAAHNCVAMAGDSYLNAVTSRVFGELHNLGNGAIGGKFDECALSQQFPTGRGVEIAGKRRDEKRAVFLLDVVVDPDLLRTVRTVCLDRQYIPLIPFSVVDFAESVLS